MSVEVAIGFTGYTLQLWRKGGGFLPYSFRNSTRGHCAFPQGLAPIIVLLCQECAEDLSVSINEKSQEPVKHQLPLSPPLQLGISHALRLVLFLEVITEECHVCKTTFLLSFSCNEPHSDVLLGFSPAQILRHDGVTLLSIHWCIMLLVTRLSVLPYTSPPFPLHYLTSELPVVSRFILLSHFPRRVLPRLISLENLFPGFKSGSVTSSRREFSPMHVL